jgi:hypothetical protein
MELVHQHRQSRHQNFNSLGILFGVAFTAASLVFTSLTLRSAQQGQITDRYTKAIEQLGSDRREVRIGGIYALERLLKDSPGDATTILDVLSFYVREHDPAPKVTPPEVPDSDIAVALTVIFRSPHPHVVKDGTTDRVGRDLIDLHGIRVPNLAVGYLSRDLTGLDLRGADLRGANLEDVDLSDSWLVGANLSSASLSGSTLHGTWLCQANLRDADLEAADLRGAITNANVRGGIRRFVGDEAYMRTTLFGTEVPNTDLKGMDLRGANLSRADLSGYLSLDGVDLRGAILTEVVGWTADEIRQVAKTDASTKF